MSGRTERDAVAALVDTFQRVLGCVTDPFVDVAGGYYASDSPHSVALNRGHAAPLSGRVPLGLRVTQQYRVVEAMGIRRPWRTQTAAYSYAIDDAEGNELLAYHWHPQARSAVTTPHLHVRVGAEIAGVSIHKVHLPTGRISIEQVVLLAIEDLGVQPRKDDWEGVLTQSQRDFEVSRTWS